jgi:hypothetical protein
METPTSLGSLYNDRGIGARLTDQDYYPRGGSKVGYESDLEPMQDEKEIEPEYSESYAVDRDKGLFGDPSVRPSYYYCVECNEDILAQDVAWDEEDQPRCPECDSILERRSQTRD